MAQDIEAVASDSFHKLSLNSVFVQRMRWLFDTDAGPRNGLIPRWIFLRALAVFYFSAFLSLVFQIEGLIGPDGILPAKRYLAAVLGGMGPLRFWYAPTVFWVGSGSQAMMVVVWAGMIASVAAFCNVWPRVSFLICFGCFLSFVAAAQEFSGYQSDGMLLEAGFLALFFAPSGFLPGWGAASPPSRASLFLLRWEWFRIYFESGIVKLLSGDPEWRNYTAMDDYYQNGPLPTWIGWYVQHLPHWFHAATVVGTLGMELAVVWMLFLPRRARLICFLIVTPWEMGVILTANYTFLNYLVLALGFLLLDDESMRWVLPARWKKTLPVEGAREVRPSFAGLGGTFRVGRIATTAVALSWIAYATTAEMVHMKWPDVPLPNAPVAVLEPFRIANQYGLFAVMTRERYEIEFQGSNDGQNWTPYRFRFKPQALNEAPGIYAPYQPRFEWNLWFASLGDWQQNNMVPFTEEALLKNDAAVLSLFRQNPFGAGPPKYMRAVLWQYWFTTMEEKRSTGNWWKRNLMGLYAPEIVRQADGTFNVVLWPDDLGTHD